MKLINLWTMLVGLLLACNAQAVGYTASITTAYPALAISASAPQVAWYGGNCGNNVNTARPYITCDDGVSPVMPIGFAFSFAGTSYNNWSMSSNGVIFFETGAVGSGSTGNQTFTPSNLPATSLGNPAKAALMPFWADLQHNASAAGANNVGQPANASFYQYQVVTQPSGTQVLVVQLKNVNFWSSGGVYVNMQVQLWSTGQIVYSYGSMQATTATLRIGLQSAGGTYCHTLASNQTIAMSDQSFVYQWDTNAAACAAQTVVNHYEIRHDGAATLCAEPVTLLACSSATTPCPAGSILRSTSTPALLTPLTAQVTVTGAGVTNVTRTPPSVNILPLDPLQNINLTWASGSSGTATLGMSASVAAAGALRCTNADGTATSACTMTVANTACIAPPHHFEVQGPANGSTCTNQSFTIKAWANAAQTIAYTAGAATGTLTASGNPASIPSLGAFTIPAGSSTVAISPITFPAAGTTTFGTTATPALAGANTCSFGGSSSCAFTVASCLADFNCVETTTSGASAADSNPATGRLYTKRAGTAFSFDVVARKSDGTAATTYAADADKSVTVELVDGAGASACASRDTLSPAQSQVLVFAKTGQPTDLGRKSVSFTVANAYQDLRCRVTDGTQVPTLVACSGDNFAVRPSAVTLSTSASAAPPPAANAASGAPTVKAGLGFTLQASTSTGTNYVGTLALDTTKLSAQTSVQASTWQSGGAVGTLTPTTLATNPAVQPTANATYSEVGYLYLAAGAFYDNASPAFTAVDSAGDCIAGSFSDAFTAGKLGCNIGNANALSLGRFVPDHFDTAIVQATAPVPCPAAPFACPANAGGGASGLLYASQPVSIKVTAKNAIGAGATTANYQGVFAKASTLSAWSAAGSAGTANPGGGSLANTAMAATVFAEGAGTTPASNPNTTQPTYALGTLATAPTDLYFRAVDADDVTSLRASAVEAGLKVANGRIYLPNAYGSERLPLPIKAMVQYYNGTAWMNSLTDSASPFDSRLLAAGGNVVVSVLSGLGGGVTIANPATAAVAGGVRSFNLAAPMAGGSANISLNAPLYLPSTTSRATFGIFRSPLVYRRENY